MSTVSATEALIGQVGNFNGINFSGTFIPIIWSSKLQMKFYASSVFADVSNTNWEGEIKNLGDKVVINTVPSLTVQDYSVGATLTYEVPTPSVIELAIDRAKYFAFQINDVIAYQSQPNLMDMFTTDAGQQMRTKIDADCWAGTWDQAAAANMGATAGAISGAYNLGTNTAPLALNTGNILQTITAMASVLDEQNIPDTERWLVITPYERQLLMNSNLAQAQFMGDAQSVLRNSKIGRIDRFDVYLSTNLPKAAADQDWAGGADAGKVKRHTMIAGHKQAMTFASQITKMETVRNPNDFGDFIRSLHVYGRKVILPTALTSAVIAG